MTKLRDKCVLSLTASEFQEVEVHLRRQKSGFGFRILGGEEPGQPVSLEAQEKARTLGLTTRFLNQSSLPFANMITRLFIHFSFCTQLTESS